MLRGYRSIVVALVGLVLAAHHPHAEAQPQQRAPQERSASALEHIATSYDQQAKGAESSPVSRKCERGDDQRDSDLCAQWKAADAAANSAWWAGFSGWFSGLSFLGVIAAIGLAFHSNWIARDTAKRELRAYVSINGVEIGPANGANPHKLQATANFKNTGQTPAIDLEASLWIAVAAGSFLEQMPVVEHPIEGSPSKTVLGAGLEQQISHITEITGHTSGETLTGDFTILVHGVIKYRDIFGTGQETRFQWYHNTNTRATGTPTASCPAGNSMT
ncbi:MAG: hypothetical protein ABIP41_02890 [Croceibacterium sp.]